jgi:hypothetical protein
MQNRNSPASKHLSFPQAFSLGTISAGRLGNEYNLSVSSVASVRFFFLFISAFFF